MGEVWSAEHMELNTKVAVKFLSTSAGGNAAKVALERFRFEAQVSAQLGLKTSHVASVHDAGCDTAGPYLVMEYVRGRSLRVELNKKGPLDPQTVANIIDQVAEALSVAHGFGIVHRDLKPSNLLLIEQPGRSFFVKVADFGIAKAIRSDLAVDRPEDTSDGWMLGSPAYMSPEQMGGGGIDARTDIWAVGVIAFEALTGRLPFPGRSVDEIISNMSTGRPIVPSSIRPSLSRELDDWFLRVLARKKEDRFGSMEEMAREFQSAVASRPARRLPRLIRALTVATSLAAALVGLRPSPSEALAEMEVGALPAVLTAPEVPFTMLGAPVAVEIRAVPDAPRPALAKTGAMNQAGSMETPSDVFDMVPPAGIEAALRKDPGVLPLPETTPTVDRSASVARTPASSGARRRVLTEAF
jgi:serine/threonine-protein kinase